MSSAVTPSAAILDPLDLTALLCSRVCHDLISPSGAIVNGLEVLEDAQDEETKAFALDLIKKSAVRVSARLQFCRLAFGASGSAGAQIDLGDAEKVARGALEDEKVKLSWSLPRLLLPKNRVKLVLNLLLLAGHTIPRGGTLSIAPVGEGEAMGFRIETRGTNARVPPHLPQLVAGTPEEPAMDAHAVQPYYAGLLARACGLDVAFAAVDDAIVITATASAGAEAVTEVG